MSQSFLKESARDLISFGSPIFFLIVLARVSMTANYIYLSEFVFAGILFFIMSFLFNANARSGIGAIILVFTSIYYNSIAFAVFAAIIYILFLTSLVYLGENKKEVAKGTMLGFIIAGIVYYVVRLFFG